MIAGVVFTGDKRRLTNAQREAMGLRRRGHPAGKRGPRVRRLSACINIHDTPPEVRLAEQLHEMFSRWPEWVRALNR